MIRRIGIDFGTSTTVLQVKNYESDGVTPVGDRIDTKDVKFGKQSYCDTYVKQKQDRWYCGPEAAKNIPDAIAYANFKMQIESPDAQIAEGAREAILHFFQYLYKTYAEQRDNGQFGEKAEREETLVSYPVKWRQETAEFLLQTAAQAGFSNIRHMNEARAAISAVMTQSAQQLSQLDKNEQNILLCDMGAGTCDLVLCRYKAIGVGELRILSCWPRGGSALTFGGREIDVRLQEYIVRIMERNNLPVKRLKSSLKEFKAWKELEVSPMLAEGYEVESCDIIENSANGDCIDYPPMTRALLETLIQGEMQDFIRLVNGAMKNCEEPFEKVDLVILVGGNSQWYFIRDLLEGKTVGGDAVEATIPRDRIFCPPNPQMTVAMGLVLSDLPMLVTNEEVIAKAAAPDRPETETLEPKSGKDAPLHSSGAVKNLVLSQEGIEVLRNFIRIKGVYEGSSRLFTSEFIKLSQTALPNIETICGRVRKGMNLCDDIEIYLAHDSTILDSGKKGLVICDRGITGGRELILWNDFINGHFDIEGRSLIYKGKSVVDICMHPNGSDDHNLLNEIITLQRILKPYMVTKENSGADILQTQISNIVRDEIRTLPFRHDPDSYVIDQSERAINLIKLPTMINFMKKNVIGVAREVYAWTDLSISKVGKGDGQLINEWGIYYKGLFEPMRFTSWNQLSNEDLDKCRDVYFIDDQELSLKKVISKISQRIRELDIKLD